MSSIFKEEAIPLIYFENKTQKYTINNDAMEIIKAIPAPIGVISVVGMYRTGKSYLMNRMILNKQKGFGVGPTVNPCTKGLWIWGSPIKGQSPDGNPINIIVIDTEGIGALDEDSNHDTRVFSLAVLLSSVFIYNSVGSIDENAIQNLSLVVSLTKHIQVKSSAYDEQLDSEDYARYFPSFLWIIRDFTLQLIDQDGEPLTSKEYLENSLQLQNGFSDDIEQKNRIRRLLLTFFQDRDCFTMVRPLLDETNLQNLENISINKLRPEFTEQIMQLRKKTILKMRPKLMNGKTLSGENFCGLIICYNEAINNGSIPNIESSWQYICRDENQKAQNLAENIFEQQMQENVRNKLPLSELELKIQYKSAKESALQEFHKKVMGDDLKEYIDELKQFFKSQISTIDKLNEDISNQICLEFVQYEYQVYDKQLKSHGYQSFNQYFKAIQQFQKYLYDKGPNLKNSQQIYSNFILDCVVEGAMIFNKQLRDDIEINKQLLNDRNKKLENEVKDVKISLNQQIQQKNEQLNNLELQVQQIEQEKMVIQYQYNDFKKQKDSNESINKRKLDEEKIKSEIEMNNLKQQISQIQDGYKDKERNFLFKESDFQKEKALLTQKVEFLENTIYEYKKKEQENDMDSNVKKSEMDRLVKDIKSKFEIQLKTQLEQITELQEKNYDYQLNFQTIQEKCERETNKFVAEKKLLQKQIQDQSVQIVNFKNEIASITTENSDQSNSMSQVHQNQIQQLQSKLDIMQNYHKDNEEEIKSSRITIQNKTAIMLQKQQFLEMELENCQNQLVEAKRQHEATIQAFQFSQNNDKTQIDNQYVITLKEKLENEQKRTDETVEEIKKRLQNQIAELNTRNNDLEFKLKYQESDSQKECSALKEALQQSEQQRQQTISLNKNLEKQQQQGIKEIENRTKKQILLLEAELEEYKIKESRNQREYQEQSEIELENLRNLYDGEKQKQEKRFLDEKMKADSAYQNMIEEYEQRLREEQNQMEEEQDQYNQDIQDLQLQMYNQQQHSENEIQMKLNELDIKEQTIIELSNQLNELHEQNGIKLLQLKQQQEDEKIQQTKVLDLRGQEIQRMEKESMYLKQQIEHLEQNLQKKDSQIEQFKNTMIAEKQGNDSKNDEQRKKYQIQQDEFLENKINYEKEIALSKQQIEFLQNKLSDIQKMSETNNKKYDSQLKNQKEDLLKEYNEKSIKLQQEKDNAHQKHEQLKKQSKSKESQLSEKINELEKDRLLFQDKLYQAEHQLNDSDNKNQKEIQILKQKLEQQQKSLLTDKQPLKSENDKLKAQVEKLEVEKSETQSLYERDKVLWEQKFVFLQNQKEQAKKDHEEAIRKFDQTLIHMSMIRKNQESEVQQNLGEMLNTIEKKYQVQIQDLNENHNREVEMFEDKIRKLEKELSNVSDKMLLDSHGKWGNQYLNEKKFNDMLENEKTLLKEIQELKSDNERLQRESYKLQEMERDNFKQKLYEIENKAKESENRRSHLIYEHEKQRAQWNLEKDHLSMKNNELQDNYSRLERKKEILLRENEKLKADCKSQRRTTNTTSLMSNQGALNLIRQSHMGNQQIEQARQSALNESQQHLERFSGKLNSSRFGLQNPSNMNNTSINNQYYKDENILNESLSEQDISKQLKK